MRISGVWHDPAVIDEITASGTALPERGRMAGLGLNGDVQAASPFGVVNDYVGLARNAATASCTVG